MNSYILLGAGGHAKALAEAIVAGGGAVTAYVDPKRCDWLDCRHETDEAAVSPADGGVVLGLGGLSPAKLAARLALLESMLERGFEAPPLIHPAAHVSASTSLAPGAAVLAGAVVQPGVELGVGAIVNSGAIVEHDSAIGDGCHIAPGAIVLGDCHIQRCSFVGAGTVILQGRNVAADSFIPALQRYGGDKS